MRSELEELLIGMEVELHSMVHTPHMNYKRGRIVERLGAEEYLVSHEGLAAQVSRGNLRPVCCSYCGADLYAVKKMLVREEEERNALQEDVTRLRRIAGVHASDAAAMRDEVARLQHQVDALRDAASRRTNAVEARLLELVATRVADSAADADTAVAANVEHHAAGSEHRVQKAERDHSRCKVSLDAAGEAGYAGIQAARAVHEHLSDLYTLLDEFATRHAPLLNGLPAAVQREQRQRLAKISDGIAKAMNHNDSAHNWAAQVCELAGRPRPAGMGAAPTAQLRFLEAPSGGSGGSQFAPSYASSEAFDC